METEIVFALLTLELDLTWPTDAAVCVVLRASLIYSAQVHARAVTLNRVVSGKAA